MAEASIWGEDKMSYRIVCAMECILLPTMCYVGQNNHVKMEFRSQLEPVWGSGWCLRFFAVHRCSQVQMEELSTGKGQVGQSPAAASWSSLTCGNSSVLLLFYIILAIVRLKMPKTHCPKFLPITSQLQKIFRTNCCFSAASHHESLSCSPRCRYLLLRAEGPILGSSLCPRGSSNIWRCRSEWQN